MSELLAVTAPVRNRIKAHRRVKARDLVPHEANFREHAAGQQNTIRGLYQEIGFARSLLAYELPDGRLKLIDGHLRRDLDLDMDVDVEVLDVTEDEAKVLLASIDPLSLLATHNGEQFASLLASVAPSSATLSETFASLLAGPDLVAQESAPAPEPKSEAAPDPAPNAPATGDSIQCPAMCPCCGEQFFVTITS